jgi:hypothetical protein
MTIVVEDFRTPMLPSFKPIRILAFKKRVHSFMKKSITSSSLQPLKIKEISTTNNITL